MKRRFKIRTLTTLVMVFVLMTFASTQVVAQANAEMFGQSRIQTRKYDWKFFDTEHFRIYHYDASGKQLARYVAEQAEKDIKIVERKMGGKFPHRFNIILYNNYDEYLQTNVGKKYDAQVQDIPAGTVDLVGDRLVVYYTGVHTDLRRQLRSGMSKVVMERMLFGESFREMVKNAVLLNLPPWVTNGFIAYVVDGWDTESETNWKNLLAANPNIGFYSLAEKEPELAGKAFWKFISEKYGENNVKNLFYNIQMKSSLPQGIKLTIGQKLKDTYKAVVQFYNEIYEKDALVQEHPDSTHKAILEIDVPKDNTLIRSIKVSPHGFDVAYVDWKEGAFKIYIQHTKGQQEKKVILSGGVKDYNEIPDPDYPLMTWSNSGYKLAVLYRKSGKTRLRIYNSIKARLEDYVVPDNRFDRVLGMSFMEDDNYLILSAIKKSQTDLYQLRIRGSRITQITKDAWDDVSPWFVSGGSRRGVLFMSNRPQANMKVPIEVNELPTGPMNVFFYDTKTKRPELLQLSSITTGSIAQPIQYGSDHFAYLYDSNGINNKYVVLFARNQFNRDSAYALPVTNYSTSIISHQYNAASNQVSDVVQVGNKYKVYFKPLVVPGDTVPSKKLEPTTLSVSNSVNVAPVTEPNTIVSPERVPQSILKSGDVFQSEFSAEAEKTQVDDQDEIPEINITDQLPEADWAQQDSFFVDSTYVKLKPQPYRLSFRPDFFSVRLDNSLLFNKYQSIYSDINQSLSGMLTVSLNDALEDHRFTGGIRLPRDFSGMTYYLQYENFKRRLDWSILMFRSDNSFVYDVVFVDTSTGQTFPTEQLGKTTSTILQGGISYPFDKRRSIRANLALRQDVLNFKARDAVSLLLLDKIKTYWGMARVEYVFDNTVSPALNIHYGLRYKIYSDYFYKLSKPNGGFYNAGFDARYYHKIYKKIIGAARIAYAHSGGNQKILYVMGGVDNWLAPKTSAIPPPQGEDFAFMTLTTSLRGYEQNSRSGNTFALINAEVRAPILTSFVRRPIQSAFLKNLQLTGFVDVGSAWNGLVPNSLTRPITFRGSVSANPIVVTINADNGVAIGYGTGLRTMLFGYFMRMDVAWNIEGGTKPIWYFGIGTDF